MHRFRAKIIAFTFILIMSVPVLLSLTFVLRQIVIQQEVEKKMKSGVLQTISISKAGINWVKPGKEILLDNRLFDVKHFESGNEMVTLTGFFDDEETELITDLKKYADSTHQKSPLGETVFKFHFPTLYNSYADIHCITSWQFISNQYHSFSSRLPLAPSLNFTRPPKLS